MNMYRYKYMPFSEGSLCVLSEGTMKFSDPSEFNDPFDCAPDHDSEKFVKHAKESDLIKQVGDSLGYSPAKRLQQKRIMLKRFENAVKNGGFNDPKFAKHGICCLSRSALNLLMWSHYAQDHKGFVVEFAIPRIGYLTENKVNSKIYEWLVPLEVKYVDDKPLIDPYDDNSTNMEKNFLTKATDWAYEQEERVIDTDRGAGIHPYDRKVILNSVFAGMRMEKNDFNRLGQVISTMNSEVGTEVRLHKVEPIPRKYGLFVNDRPELLAS